uniref:Endo/exonuclease/phosphatase domain-containing protein n=1 Tax=Ascaris lumbricoides TaxID=6252 RepID=A0A0M3HTS4_ASCLU
MRWLYERLYYIFPLLSSSVLTLQCHSCSHSASIVNPTAHKCDSRGFCEDPKIDTYLGVMANIKADVTGISETRRSNDVVAEWHTGDQVFLSRAFDYRKRNGGVGFILRKEMMKHVKSCDLISPRIAVLILRLTGRRTITIIQAYATAQNNNQTPEEADEDIERVYQEIEEAMQVGSTYTVIQGDFNDTVGNKICKAEGCVGGFGIRYKKRKRTPPYNFRYHLLLRSTLILNVKCENAILKKGCPPRRNLNADTFSNLMETVDFSMNRTNTEKDYEQFVANLLKTADLACEVKKSFQQGKDVSDSLRCCC